MNICCLTGNLVRPPELKYTLQGTAVVKMTIAYNEYYRERKTVHFFDIDVWGKMAENCNMYLTKGSKIAVTGVLQQNRWEQDGQKRSRVTIRAANIEFLTPKREEEEMIYDI